MAAVPGLSGIFITRKAGQLPTKSQGQHHRLQLMKTGKAADLVAQPVHETLAYYTFPNIHWQKIGTNDRPERIVREICRRISVSVR